MDIKLKKYEEVYTPLKKLFSKPLRIVAFILAAVFAASAVAADGYSDMLGYDPTATGSYTDSTEYRSKLTDEYEQLCIYAVCYLNNLDSKGKFTGSDNLYADFTYYLDYNGYTYQKTDNGIEPYSELFDFYVSYKNADGKTRSLTNIDFDKSVTDDNRTEWLKSNFSNYILRSNDLITSDNASSGVMVDYTYCTAESGYFNNNGNETGDYYYYNDDYYSDSTNDFVYYGDYNGYSSADATTESYSDNFVPLGGWFYDNYGRYFYNFGNSSPIRFFEDSAKTKKGRIARAGAVYHTFSNTDDVYSTDEVAEDYSNSYYYTYLEDESDYEATDGDTSGITLFISPKKSVIKTLATTYERNAKNYRIATGMIYFFMILSVLLVLYDLASCGYGKKTTDGILWEKTKLFGRIYDEIYIIAGIVFFALFLLFGDVFYWTDESIKYTFGTEAVAYIVIVLAETAVFAGLELCLVQLAVKFKTKSFINDSLIVRLWKKLMTLYMGSDFYKHRNERYMGEKFTSRSITVLVCCFAVALSFILCALWGEIQFFLIIAVISFLIVCVNEIRNIRDFANLVKLSKQIDSMGEDKPFEETIPESSAVYAESEKLINLSQKMSVSLEEQLKSERLKIELVANVSHDLKTPLTSIISYIDLLKKLDLDDEAKSYVQIIDKKSQKLKGIVADVFAIAKASSGIEVDLTEIDFVMLFNQAFADAYDKIEAVGLTVKTSIEIDSACVMADGDKLYRVFQNLIDNALNYSLKGSRIFMTVKRDGENAVFISKNISASPIDFTADEITERFVRGDKNRTDGGSGLGLSIAKSFTEACGGSFEITLDGDTFITTVTMPIYKK